MMPLLAFCIHFSEIKSSVAGAELQELLGSKRQFPKSGSCV